MLAHSKIIQKIWQMRPEAIQSIEEALDRAANLGRSKRLQEAEAVIVEVLNAAPNHARAQHLLASIFESRGDLERAVTTLTQCAAANPDEFDIHAHLSALLRGLGRLDQSLEHARRAAELRPNDVQNLSDLATLHLLRGEDALAHGCCERALALQPEFAPPHNTLGLIALQNGDLDRAKLHFEDFVRAAPNAAHGYINLLESYEVRSGDDPHVSAIERQLERGPASADEMLLRFALAKAYRDLGREEVFLRQALTAASLKRSGIRYDEATTLKQFGEIQATFTAELMQRMREGGYRSQRPVFIVSMPRAGSTLVEQILASHPMVFGAGELTDYSEAVAAAWREADMRLKFPQFVSGTAPAMLTRIGELYIQRTSPRAPDSSIIVDKMPDNYLMVGLISLTLPDAKIIHVTRDPLDTCVSCFSKHFEAHHEYTYELAELGRYYSAYARLMEHWRAIVPPGAILEVQYEALIQDLEGQARRLLTHCRLPWDDAVLRFHETKRPIKTLSLAQVRQPIYRNTSGRWRKYDTLLRPLLEALGDLQRS
jgi:tetratricopeptide (TPR) repeat protein